MRIGDLLSYAIGVPVGAICLVLGALVVADDQGIASVREFATMGSARYLSAWSDLVDIVTSIFIGALQH